MPDTHNKTPNLHIVLMSASLYRVGNLASGNKYDIRKKEEKALTYWQVFHCIGKDQWCLKHSSHDLHECIVNHCV